MVTKAVTKTALLLAAALLAPAVYGVTIDLSSPQEGATVYPGDTVELTATITNDTDAMDLIGVSVTLTVEIPGDPHVFEGQFRLPLEAGETASESMEFDIPADLPVPAEIPITLEATAVGFESGTEDSDSIGLTLAPLPGKDGEGVSIDISSPQEGTTVYPGDTVEFSATVANNTDVDDLIIVAFTLTADIPGDPFTHEGQLRIPLAAGESVTESIEIEIPADLPVPAPVLITIEATATGTESGAEDSDSLTITVAPNEDKDGDGISIDISSPQEGTTVHPGDTIEMTAAIANNTEIDDIIEIAVTLTADVPGDPFSYQGTFRVPLQAGESVSETVEFDVPTNLPIEAPVLVTIEANAVGLESGAEDSDTFSITVAPAPGKLGGLRLRLMPLP